MYQVQDEEADIKYGYFLIVDILWMSYIGIYRPFLSDENSIVFALFQDSGVC